MLQVGCLSGLYPETLKHRGIQHPALGMGGRPRYTAPAVRAEKRALGYVAGMAHLISSQSANYIVYEMQWNKREHDRILRNMVEHNVIQCNMIEQLGMQWNTIKCEWNTMEHNGIRGNTI